MCTRGRTQANEGQLDSFQLTRYQQAKQALAEELSITPQQLLAADSISASWHLTLHTATRYNNKLSAQMTCCFGHVSTAPSELCSPRKPTYVD